MVLLVNFSALFLFDKFGDVLIQFYPGDHWGRKEIHPALLEFSFEKWPAMAQKKGC